MSTLYYETDYLEHHGIKGQKWGVRRFQREDGSYTPAGHRRYLSPKEQKRVDKAVRKHWVRAYNAAADVANRELIPAINKKYEKYDFRDRNTNEKIRKKYEEYVNEYAREFNKVYEQKVSDIFGGLPSGGIQNLPGYFETESGDGHTYQRLTSNR